MNDFFSNFRENARTILNEAHFKRIPIGDDVDKMTTELWDELTPELMDWGLLLTLVRRYRFSPPSVFEIEVSFCIRVDYADTPDYDAVKTADIKKLLLEQERIPWTYDATTKASILISQMTACNGVPLVTPPTFIRKR